MPVFIVCENRRCKCWLFITSIFFQFHCPNVCSTISDLNPSGTSFSSALFCFAKPASRKKGQCSLSCTPPKPSKALQSRNQQCHTKFRNTHSVFTNLSASVKHKYERSSQASFFVSYLINFGFHLFSPCFCPFTFSCFCFCSAGNLSRKQLLGPLPLTSARGISQQTKVCLFYPIAEWPECATSIPSEA